MAVWVSDSEVVECFGCGAPFSALRRRHHCRLCGAIYCSSCSSSCCLSVVGGPQGQEASSSIRLCVFCVRNAHKQQQLLGPLTKLQRHPIPTSHSQASHWGVRTPKQRLQGAPHAALLAHECRLPTAGGPWPNPHGHCSGADRVSSSSDSNCDSKSSSSRTCSSVANGTYALSLLRQSVLSHCVLEGLPAAAACVLLRLILSVVSALHASAAAAAVSLGDCVHVCCFPGQSMSDSRAFPGVVLPLLLQHKQQQQLLPLHQARVLLVHGDLQLGGRVAEGPPGRFTHLETVQRRHTLALRVLLQQLALLQPNLLLLSGSLPLSLLLRLAALKIVAVPGVPFASLLRASRATGAPLWASLELAAARAAAETAQQQQQTVLGSCSVHWGAPTPGAPSHLILSDCPPSSFWTICLVLPTSAATAAAPTSAWPEVKVSGKDQEAETYRRVLWRGLCAAFALQQELKFIAACCYPGGGPQGPLWIEAATKRQLLLPQSEESPGPGLEKLPQDDDSITGASRVQTLCSNTPASTVLQQREQQDSSNSDSTGAVADAATAMVNKLLESTFRQRPLKCWLQCCSISVGSGGPRDLERRLLECMCSLEGPPSSTKYPPTVAAAAAAAAATNCPAVAAVQLLTVIDGEKEGLPNCNLDIPGAPPVDPTDLGEPLRVPTSNGTCGIRPLHRAFQTTAPSAAEAAPEAAVRNAIAAAAASAPAFREEKDVGHERRRLGTLLLRRAFSLEAQIVSLGITWSCRLQQCATGAGSPWASGAVACLGPLGAPWSPGSTGTSGALRRCPCALAFSPFGATLREVASRWCLFLQQHPGSRSCPAGDSRCRRPLNEHSLAFTRDTNRVVVTFNEGLLVPQGEVSRAPAAARRRSRYEGSPMLSPLPPARTAEATANATGDKPAATEAAASTAADSVRCNSKLEDALFSAKDLPSALSEPIRAASAERTAETTGTEGSWDCTEKNGGPAGVDWWQTCRRCGGGALGASEDIGRYGDLPFIRFLELLLTDETLRGDGTRSGALQQQQQMDQQQGVLQQQQHQQLEQEREQVLNGDKGAPSCPHYIFRDRTFYFASGNATLAFSHQSLTVYSICKKGAPHQLLKPISRIPTCRDSTDPAADASVTEAAAVATNESAASPTALLSSEAGKPVHTPAKPAPVAAASKAPAAAPGGGAAAAALADDGTSLASCQQQEDACLSGSVCCTARRQLHEAAKAVAAAAIEGAPGGLYAAVTGWLTGVSLKGTAAGSSPSALEGGCALSQALQKSLEGSVRCLLENKVSWATRGRTFLTSTAAAVERQIKATEKQQQLLIQGAPLEIRSPLCSCVAGPSDQGASTGPPGGPLWRLWSTICKLLVEHQRSLSLLLQELQQAAAILMLFSFSLQQVTLKRQQQQGPACSKENQAAAAKRSQNNAPGMTLAEKGCYCWKTAERLLRACDFSWFCLDKYFEVCCSVLFKRFACGAEDALREAKLPGSPSLLPLVIPTNDTASQQEGAAASVDPAAAPVATADSIAAAEEQSPRKSAGFVVLTGIRTPRENDSLFWSAATGQGPTAAAAAAAATATAKETSVATVEPRPSKRTVYYTGKMIPLLLHPPAVTPTVSDTRDGRLYSPTTTDAAATAASAASGVAAAPPQSRRHRSASCEVVWRVVKEEDASVSPASPAGEEGAPLGAPLADAGAPEETRADRSTAESGRPFTAAANSKGFQSAARCLESAGRVTVNRIPAGVPTLALAASATSSAATTNKPAAAAAASRLLMPPAFGAACGLPGTFKVDHFHSGPPQQPCRRFSSWQPLSAALAAASSLTGKSDAALLGSNCTTPSRETVCLHRLRHLTAGALHALEASVSDILARPKEGLHDFLPHQESKDVGALIASAILSPAATHQLKRRWTTEFVNTPGACCGGLCGKCINPTGAPAKCPPEAQVKASKEDSTHASAEAFAEAAPLEPYESSKPCLCCLGTCAVELCRARRLAKTRSSSRVVNASSCGGKQAHSEPKIPRSSETCASKERWSVWGGPCSRGCLLLPSALAVVLAELSEGFLEESKNPWGGFSRTDCKSQPLVCEGPLKARSFQGRGDAVNPEETKGTGNGQGSLRRHPGQSSPRGLLACDLFSCCLFVPPFCCANSPVPAEGVSFAAHFQTLVALSPEESTLGIPWWLRESPGCESLHSPALQDEANETELRLLRSVLEAPIDSGEQHVQVHQLGDDRSHSVTLFFAPQFHILRHLLCGDDLQFCCSIKSATPVKLFGGKSGASFTLSSDGVYVLKELNRHEVKLLLCQSDSFFRHFSRVLLEGRPSALTPILGLFQVKNAINGDKRYYVALSNLRYREGGAPKGPIRVFDLKGLGRQRYIPETDSHAIHSGTNSSSNSGTGGGAAARRAGRQNRTAAAMLKEAAASTATPAANDAAAVSSDENYSPKILAATEEPFSSKDASFPAAGEGLFRFFSTATPPATPAVTAAEARATTEISAAAAAAGEFETLDVHAALECVPVLWDQNFREYSRGFALCMHSSDVCAFREALRQDLSLLQRLEVVDYSLLVVVYEDTAEICFGLIDFFRKYTWDKHVEKLGKALAYMTSGLQPTVLSPGDYRQRFTETLREFFAPALPSLLPVSLHTLRALAASLTPTDTYPQGTHLSGAVAAALEDSETAQRTAESAVAEAGRREERRSTCAEEPTVPFPEAAVPAEGRLSSGVLSRSSTGPLPSFAACLAAIVRDQQQRDAAGTWGSGNKCDRCGETPASLR